MIHVITILFFWSIGLQKNVYVFFWNFWRPLNLKMRIPKTSKFENWNFENLKVGECIFWTPENLKWDFWRAESKMKVLEAWNVWRLGRWSLVSWSLSCVFGRWVFRFLALEKTKRLDEIFVLPPPLQRLLIKTRFQNVQWILKIIFWRPANLNMKVLKTWKFKNGVSENQ